MATAETDRAKSGKFKSRYDKNALYPLVADVCRFVNPEEPELVSQPDFDRSRAAAGHPNAPSARAIYGRLKMPWEEIKRIALDPERDAVMVSSALTKTAERKLKDAEVYFALNRVATKVGARTFSIATYERTVSDLIARDQRRNGADAILETLLPTAHQLVVHAGSWNDALRTAGLEPYEQQTDKTALTIAEAYDLIVDLTGKEPPRLMIDELRSRFGVSVSKPPSAAQWTGLVASFRKGREARGMTVPTETLTTDERKAFDIPQPTLDGLPRKRDKGHWTYERCLTALAEFLELPEKTHSLKRYQALYPAQDWPALNRIQAFAPFAAMRDAARHLLQTGEILPLEKVDAKAP